MKENVFAALILSMLSFGLGALLMRIAGPSEPLPWMDSAAAAPEGAPIPDPWPSETPSERSIKFYSGIGSPPEGFFDDPAPAPPSSEYSAVWIPGHWRPLADGEVITEMPPLPKTPLDRRPGESFDEWEKRIKPKATPKPDNRRPDPVAVRETLQRSAAAY